MRAMYRYQVPIDDKEHTFSLYGSPMGHIEVSVDIGNPVVEFWAEHDDAMKPHDATFRVFGTGHEIPDDDFWYVGTCPRWMGLVFHLYQRIND